MANPKIANEQSTEAWLAGLYVIHLFFERSGDVGRAGSLDRGRGRWAGLRRRRSSRGSHPENPDTRGQHSCAGSQGLRFCGPAQPNSGPALARMRAATVHNIPFDPHRCDAPWPRSLGHGTSSSVTLGE